MVAAATQLQPAQVIYKRANGAHISNADAAIVGLALEATRVKFGSGFTLSDFEAVCKDKSQPVYPIWKKRADFQRKSAGHEAARYLMNSVVVYIVDPKTGVQTESRPVVLVRDPQPGDSDELRRSYEPQVVMQRVDLLEAAEQEFRRNVSGCMEAFVAVAGKTRMRTVVFNLLKQF